MSDSVPAEATAAGLGLGDLSFVVDFSHGGQSPCWLVTLAAMAIAAGEANAVLVYRALNGRSGTRVGRVQVQNPATQFRYPLGYLAYPQFIAMGRGVISSRPAARRRTWPRWPSPSDAMPSATRALPDATR